MTANHRVSNKTRPSLRHNQAWLSAGFIFIISWFFIFTNQAKTLELNNTDVTIQVTNSTQTSTQARVLWLPSEYGVLPEERKIAQQLSQYGIESWQVDLFEALFLSPTSSAVDEISDAMLSDLIQHAQADKLPLFIIAPNKAAQLAARGLHNYQTTAKNQLGLILINPNLYIETPAPGEDPAYWPHTQTLNLPTFVLQAELSPWRWQLHSLNQQLTHAGSPIFMQILANMRDRFYFRPDALEIEQQNSQYLAEQLVDAMRLLTPQMSVMRQSGQLEKQATVTAANDRQDALKTYQGEQNLPLALPDLTGQNQTLTQYQGQVVLLNFWASWCPPCLHEMPSMTRLKKQLADQKFEILAVNLAQEPEEFSEFLSQNPVNFPILLDPQGQAIKDWRIMAYPTTYLIDKKGQIRYALFGGTEWDHPQHVDVISALLEE